MIRGAPNTRDFLKNELRNLVTSKAKVLEAWAAAGKIEPVDPVHLFSVIWAATQHYADFEVQVGALLGRRRLAADDYDVAADTIVRMVLRCCGIRYGSGRGRPLACRPRFFVTAAVRPPPPAVCFGVAPGLYPSGIGSVGGKG